MSLLTPCQSSLVMHGKRVNYQLHVCRIPLQEDEKDGDEGVELSNIIDVFYDEDSDDGEV